MVIKNELPKTELLKSDFYYDLPEELIAQTPVEPRDSSRLLLLDRETGEVRDSVFRDITEEIGSGDTLVINDSRVIPARLYGERTNGNATGPVEVLLLRQRGDDVWECLVKPGKRARPGHRIAFGGGALECGIEDIVEDGCRVVKFFYDGARYGSIYEALDDVGTVPLPPYIHEKLEDGERYQTVYAKTAGSAAAPTAGLHFTPELMAKIEATGARFVRVMLHVGLGTFRPVGEDRIADHVMHTEFITVTEDAAKTINERRAAGGRVICVGTTSCRTLESAADEDGTIRAVSGDTGIFIYPGYKFRATDALITNFHLPESTLLMLVSAFADRERVLAAYRHAVREGYRFFSFGDAMFVR